jgi:hypothetical protein
MRSPKVLEKMAVETLAMTKGGTCPFGVLAIDDEEVEWFTKFIRGKHGARVVQIVRGKPGDELPMMGTVEMEDNFVPSTPAKKAKKHTPQLTEDGY